MEDSDGWALVGRNLTADCAEGADGKCNAHTSLDAERRWEVRTTLGKMGQELAGSGDRRSGKRTGEVAAPLTQPVPLHYGTERMRQKLLVLATGVLVKRSVPLSTARLVICGIQSAGARVNDRSSA